MSLARRDRNAESNDSVPDFNMQAFAPDSDVGWQGQVA
jgi:hypothetical protein